MNNEYRSLINELLSDPEKLKQKKPFTRGADLSSNPAMKSLVELSESIPISLPDYKMKTVTQEQFMRELDPNCHKVLFDENIPSLCVKVADGDYRDVEYIKMPIPFQKIIMNKQVMHLTTYPMQFSLVDLNPTEDMQDDFMTIKKYWEKRNQDGMKRKMVKAQKSYGDAGLLYYFDYKGRIKSRILSYKDGYVLCPHNDQNGDRILESVYYQKDDVEYIDSYDDTYMYRYTNDRSAPSEKDENGKDTGWVMHKPVPHGFSEIPLITKRGDVAWNDVQFIIESFEELYNVFNAIQKRFGWGILYIKGKFDHNARKINGAVVLNDRSMEGKGDAKFLTPPSPQGTIDTLELMKESIELGSSTTFLLPKDVKTSGDISGVAIMLTMSLDIERASDDVVEWQNVADKMIRLFKEGLAKELVNDGTKKDAVTAFDKLDINASMKVWKPLDEYQFNQMVSILEGAGILSRESAIEINTLSRPDEKARIKKQDEAEKEQKEKETELKFRNTERSVEQETIIQKQQ